MINKVKYRDCDLFAHFLIFRKLSGLYKIKLLFVIKKVPFKVLLSLSCRLKDILNLKFTMVKSGLQQALLLTRLSLIPVSSSIPSSPAFTLLTSRKSRICQPMNIRSHMLNYILTSATFSTEKELNYKPYKQILNDFVFERKTIFYVDKSYFLLFVLE